MKLLFGLVALVAILYVSSLNWRRTVKVVLVLLVIEGALRKWVLPQASDVMYFLKDIVLLGGYLKYYAFSTLEKNILLKATLSDH